MYLEEYKKANSVSLFFVSIDEIPQNGEYHKTRQEAGQTIDAAGQQCVPIAIVIELIVTGQCQ